MRVMHRILRSLLVFVLLAAAVFAADTPLAAEWRKKAEAGDAVFQELMGECYADDVSSDGIPVDSVEAMKWYRLAADQGNAKAQRNLGVILGVPKDIAETVKSHRKAADQGDAKAQYNLGVMYQYSLGVPKDIAEAVKWYRKAAEQGNKPAQIELGVICHNRDAVLKYSAEDAKRLWELSVLKDGKSPFYLDFWSFLDKQSKADEDALGWYRKAACAGLSVPLCRLGVMYANGEGVPKNSAEAVKWYELAARLGHNATAQYNLGVMYANGTGVPKNNIIAAEFFEKAAVQGLGDAQYRLGVMYANGVGVPKDLVQAHVWLNLSGVSGNDRAKNKLAMVQKEMTDSQKEQAMVEARELFAALPKGR
jgi:TPR repeat protein